MNLGFAQAQGETQENTQVPESQGQPPCSFDRYHSEQLPQARLLNRTAEALGPNRSLTLRLTETGSSWTYRSDGSRLTLVPGNEGSGLLVELERAAFESFRAQTFSLVGLFYSQKLKILKGDLEEFMVWESALQMLYFDRPIWSKDDIERVKGFDLCASFSLQDIDSNPEQAQQYLNTLGYLHVREVFTDAEIEAMRLEVERLKHQAQVNDGCSWWAQNTSNEEVCCRVTYLNRRSDLFSRHPRDRRLLKLAALAGKPLVPTGDRMDGVNVVIKNSNIVSGLSDLPWHRDCGVGGHHLICPSLNVGVQLDEASADNGQLKFLAGSAEHANFPIDESDPGLPIAAINAAPGDVTLHYAHAMHVAPPPLSDSGNRRVIYCSFARQELVDAIPEGQSYNDVLFNQDEGRIRSLDDL